MKGAAFSDLQEAVGSLTEKEWGSKRSGTLGTQKNGQAENGREYKETVGLVVNDDSRCREALEWHCWLVFSSNSVALAEAWTEQAADPTWAWNSARNWSMMKEVSQEWLTLSCSIKTESTIDVSSGKVFRLETLLKSKNWHFKSNFQWKLQGRALVGRVTWLHSLLQVRRLKVWPWGEAPTGPRHKQQRVN